MGNINNHINVNFYHLSNETNPGFLAITVLELWEKISIRYIKFKCMGANFNHIT